MTPLSGRAVRPLFVLLLACTLLPLAACNRAPGAPVEPPVLIFWNTGDRAEVAEAQTGVDHDDSSYGAVSGAGFEGRVRVACGPGATGAHPPYELRFSPARATVPADGEPAPETTPDGAYALTLVIPHFAAGHDGPYEASAHLGRVAADGSYRETTGTASVELEAPGHRAGNFLASGTFEADLGGQAVTGSFDDCYYFS